MTHKHTTNPYCKGKTEQQPGQQDGSLGGRTSLCAQHVNEERLDTENDDYYQRYITPPLDLLGMDNEE